MDQDCLTNEELLKHFPNQFALALYAIRLAEEEIRSQGAESYLQSQNVATLVLGRITESIDAMKIQKTKEAQTQEKVETKVRVETKVKAVA